MPESEYKKLLNVAMRGELPDGYAFVDRTTEHDYPLLFGRFVNTNTSCPLSTSSFNGGIHGLFIDVFILFPLPGDYDAQERAVTSFLVWEQMQCWVKRRAKYRTQAFVDKWREVREFERRNGRDAALQKIESEFRSLIPPYEEAEWCLHGSGGKYDGFARLKTQWFEEAEYVPFETAMLAAPVGRYEFLDQFYGPGWREFPQGEGFAPYSCGNLNIPGPVASADYMQFIDAEQVTHDMRKYTDALVEETALMRAAEVPRATAQATLQSRKLNRELMELDCVREYAESGLAGIAYDQAVRIDEQLRGVFDLQGNKCVMRWHIPLSFEPTLLAAAMGARLVADPRFWVVKKFFDVQSEGRMDNWMQHAGLCDVARLLDACARLYIAIDREDLDSVTTCAAELDRLCPACVHAKVAHAYLLLEAPSSADRTSCLDYVKEVVEVYGRTDYLSFIECRALLASGMRDEGLAALITLGNMTNNGMVRLAIADLLASEAPDVILPVAVSQPREKRAAGKKLRSIRSFGFSGVKEYIHYGLQSVPSKSRKLAELRAMLPEYRERIERCRAFRRLTSDRLYVWERIYPRKQLIRDAVATGVTAEVRSIMYAYIDAAYRLFDATGLGLFIDEESLRAAIPVFRADRGEEFVEAFLAAIPEQHRCEDFDVMLKRNGVDHPYFRESWRP